MVKKLFPAVAVLCLVLLPLGCKNEKSGQLPLPEHRLTMQDTLDVTQLVDSFFCLSDQGQMEAILTMLHRVAFSDGKASIEPLDSEYTARSRQALQMVMGKPHRMDYVKFYHTLRNEVHTTIVQAPAQDGLPEMLSTFYLKPVKEAGTWYLCLMDVRSGDKPLVPVEKVDSMTKAYAAQTGR